MVIKNLIEQNLDDHGKRVLGEIHWEDSERPVNKIFFSVGREHQDKIMVNANSYLLAAFIPAIKGKENRILIEDSICTELLLGIRRVAEIITNWYYPEQKSKIKIDTKNKNSIKICKEANRKSGFFFSGGIDSIATLLRNITNYPKDHCNRIHYGITVHGLEIETDKQLAPVEKRLKIIADNTGIERVILKTNVRSIDTDWQFWEYQWQGSVLASIAHILTPFIRRFYIASTLDYKNLKPYGSHPLVDPAFSCDCMRVIHDGLSLNRLEKVDIVSQNDLALQNLRVCNHVQMYSDDYVNCGECEKCLRTKMALHVLGRLDKAKCFRDPSLNFEKIERLGFLSTTSKIWWREVAPFLENSDDPKLFEIVNKKAYGSLRTIKQLKRLRGLKNAIGVIDDKVLGRRLQTLKKYIDEV